MIDENEIKITVNCDSCIDGNSDYGTKTELEAAGWLIEEALELCPLCRFD
jgi:hypothetical protein